MAQDVRDTGKITKVDVPGALPSTSPFSINNHGQIVGWYADAGTRLTPDGSIPPGTVHVFLLDKGRYTTLDAPGQPYTFAQGINDCGDVLITEPGAGLMPVVTP
jgi:uncharacterized membrane protein